MAFALGIICEILATMVGTAGKQLVSYSGRADSKSTAKLFKVSGLFITTLVGPVLDMAAYALAPQGVIAPLNGLDIVWNTLSAPFTLGERLTTRHVVGSTLVFLGAASTSMFGPHSEQQESLEWLREIFLSWRFLAYILTFGSLLSVGLVLLAVRPKGTGDRVRGVALGCTAGGIAGNMYFISAGLGLFRTSASTGSWVAWQSWLPYPVLLCGILVAVLNIPFMTKGLQEYEALFMVTLFEGCHIVVACISGLWVLREMDNVAPERIVLYWFCISLIMLGLLVIQTTSSGVHGVGRARPAQTTGSGEALVDLEAGRGVRVVSSRESKRKAVDTPSTVVWASSVSGIGSMSFPALELDSSEEGLTDSDTEAGLDSISASDEADALQGPS